MYIPVCLVISHQEIYSKGKIANDSLIVMYLNVDLFGFNMTGVL